MQNKPVLVKSDVRLSLSIDAAEWYQDSVFYNWFNSRLGKGIATFQHAAQPLNGSGDQDCADLFVTVSPRFSGDGSDSDMPAKYWDAIVEACRIQFGENAFQDYIIVTLKPF